MKTHNVTGKKYLGKTRHDPYTYSGSGTDWKKHLKEFGYDISTEILKECDSKEELSKWGRHYSKHFDIVKSDMFLNRIPETGGGGSVSEEAKEKLRKINTGKKHTEATKSKMSKTHKGKKMSEETKAKISATKTGVKRPGVGGRKKGSIPWNKGLKIKQSSV